MNRFTLILTASAWLVAAQINVWADDLLIRIEDPPAHGIVAAHVDLTTAVEWCRKTPFKQEMIRAKECDSGRPVPCQFILDSETEGGKRVIGTLCLRLPEGSDGRVRLVIEPSEPPPALPWDGVVRTKDLTIAHDPSQMGGLPSRISFPATGKVFDKFVWNDRVHKRDVGGFLVRNDKETHVELLSAGPVCTVVRVRAAYKQANGKQPPTEPHAVYDWYYFNELPLVLVNANVSQRESADWAELHFLELNFPGEDFLHWAGGEPVDRGELSGSEKSFSFAQWGALVDGKNAIAVLRSGRALVYDGRGGYGTYLHAHGSRAWQAWTSTERQFTAWLWIGSADAPENAIRGMLSQLPCDANVRVSVDGVRKRIEAAFAQAVQQDDPSRQQQTRWQAALAERLEEQGRFAESLELLDGKLPANWVTLFAGDLRMVLERTADGVRSLSLRDMTAHCEFLTAEPLPLFTVTMRRVSTKEEVRVTADAGWKEVEVRHGASDSVLEIRWNGLTAAAREADSPLPRDLHVVARATPDAASHAIRWNLSVEVSDDGWSVWRVVFPQIGIAQIGGDSQVLFPRGPGEVQQGLWKKAFRYHGVYPSGWTAMQFLAAYSPESKSGLYVATHDPVASTKEISVESRPDDRAVVFSYDHPVPDMGNPRNGFTLSGEAVLQLLRGDWFDAAVIYRYWVRSQAKWFPTLADEGRTDTPLWMRELPAWALSGGASKECVSSVKAFAEFLDVPVGFHWYSWHKIPFDNDYPHYFPTTDGFADGVRELQAAGVYAMPYINGRLWDTRDKGMEDSEFSRVALPAATKDENGEPYTEMYGSKETDGSRVRLGVMCPSTDLWQSRVGAIVERLHNEYGLSGVYIDQVAAASPKLCFDTTHGHPLGGGHWWTEGYWQLLDGIRRKKSKDRILTTECNAEPYIRWFDGYLTWHWQYNGQVPAFPAIYGGSIQMFGRAYRGGETKDLALRMKAGQQLVFGEQIGWISPGVIREKENAEFLRQIVRLRWCLRRYFYAGEMARPPRLLGAIPTVQADWQWSGKWPVTTDAFLAGAWRLPQENKLVLIFVNVGDKPVSAKLAFDAVSYGLPRGELRLTRITAEGSDEPRAIPRASQHEMTGQPHAAFAWEVTTSGK